MDHEDKLEEYWTEFRIEVRAWFQRNASSLGEIYEGALRIIFDGNFPGRTRFVGHAVREIRNRLPDVISGTKSSRVEYINLLEKILPQWETAGFSLDGRLPNNLINEQQQPNSDVPVPRPLFKQIAFLVKKHKEKRETFFDKTIRLFRTVGEGGPSLQDDFRPVIIQWKEVTDWFMELAHDSGSKDSKVDMEELKRNFETFETTLGAIIRGFFKTTEELDEILEEAPTHDQIRRVIGLLVHPEHYRYFFDRLDNPEWIQPLWEKGFFTKPPSPQQDEISGNVTFPPWPESRYLARMAPLKPEMVLEVILQIPDTENFRVNEDLAEAALNMPPELSVRLLKKAKSWAQSQYLFLPENLGSLLSHFATGNQIDAALDLAAVLLTIIPAPKIKSEPEGKENYHYKPEPMARFDIWEYEEILKKDFVHLLKVADIRAFELLCSLLETAIRLSRGKNNHQGGNDYSYIWRPAIENHTQNLPDSLEDILVTAVRDAGKLLAQDKILNISKIVEVLEQRSWKIFHRIALHLLRLFGKVAQELVADRLTNQVLFESYMLRHEYSLLAKEYFGNISQDQQNIILKWIKDGPDINRFIKVEKQRTGKRPSEEDIKAYQKSWQRDRLHCIKDYLTEDWEQYYQELVKEYGGPKNPDFMVSYSSGWVGPTSPINSQELQQMSVEEILRFLKAWIPPGEHFAPSPEELGRELSSFIKQNPEKFALEALSFKGLDPIYIGALFLGLRDAIKQRSKFEWASILKLCLWTVNQKSEIPGRSNEGHLDAYSDLGWTRKAIADLLSDGFDEGPGCIPIKHRSIVWKILEPLTEDPEPTPAYESYYGGSNMDPVTLSINTTRGEAMHAVIRYGLWVHRHIKKSSYKADRLARGFDVMQEVRTVLNRHLDISCDSSLAIRAVYGQWFPRLHLLDPVWSQEQIPKIFPLDESQGALHDAAWEAYIIYCLPYDNIFEILKQQYAFAIDHLTSARGRSGLNDPEQRLVEHLMVLYWRGKLALTEDQGLLSRFWFKASPELRGHGIEVIGSHLYQSKEEISLQILERLQYLWEKRIEIAKTECTPDSYVHEMSAFGWWFISQKFKESWAIKQLLEALKISHKAKPDHLVVKRFMEIVQDCPVEVINCLKLMVQSDKEGWNIYRWRKNLKFILAKALQTPGASDAEELINHLGRRGYFEFGDLLKSIPT